MNLKPVRNIKMDILNRNEGGKQKRTAPRVLMLSGAKAQLGQLGNLCGLFIIKGLRSHISFISLSIYPLALEYWDGRSCFPLTAGSFIYKILNLNRLARESAKKDHNAS